MKRSRTRTAGLAVTTVCAVACTLPAGASAATPGALPHTTHSTQRCDGAWQPASTKGLPTSFDPWNVKVFGAHDVVLAGAYDNADDEQAAIARWNGKRWKMTNIPGGFYPGHLAGTSSHDLFVETVVASGKTKIAHLHGTKWTMIPRAKSFGGGNGFINAMVSTGPGDLWAVGPRFTAVGAAAVVTHYSGGKWHTVPNNLATTPWSVPISLNVSPKGQVWLLGEDITSSPEVSTVRIPYAGKVVGDRVRRVELPTVPGQPSTLGENINWTARGTMIISGWTGNDDTFVGYPYSSTRTPNGHWELQARQALTTGGVSSNVAARVGNTVWSADDNMLLDKGWTGLTRWNGTGWSRLQSLPDFAGDEPTAMDGDKRGDGWMIGSDQNFKAHLWQVCGSSRTTLSETAPTTDAGTPVTVGERPATTAVGPQVQRTTSRPEVGPYDGLPRSGERQVAGTPGDSAGESLHGPVINRLRAAQPHPMTASSYVSIDACAEPSDPHRMRCQAQVVARKTGSNVRAATTGVPAGYGPAAFRSAYHLPRSGGAGRTVAVVAAYGYPTLATDLAKYRKATGLPACTVASGCLTIVGQDGGTPPAKVDEGWALEQALDVQAVSAACPDCKILVVQAKSTSDDDLGVANHEAAKHKPFVINDSFGRSELSTDVATTSAMVPKGTPLVAATGDVGLLPSYPSTVPSVVGVGGTTLLQTPGTRRGWSEHLWSLSGGGCSAVQPKPAFQRQSFCIQGKSSSVAVVADADPASGAAVYDSIGYDGNAGWFVVGGTSLASPLTAGMYAARGIKPSVRRLWTGGRTTYSVTGAGTNGWCAPKIECTAKAHRYSGASGWGSLAR